MIKVISPGISITIQDKGRFGFAHYGIPAAGAMDLQSLRLANAIVNNELHTAGLEINYGSVRLEFLIDCKICVSGANFSPQINGKAIAINKRIDVSSGSIITLGKRVYGCRMYLAIQGGINVEKVFGSRSFYKGVTTKSILQKGDLIKIFSSKNSLLIKNYSRFKVDLDHFNSSELLCFKGPEFNLLTREQQNKLINFPFTISTKNSRMGYMLSEKLKNELPTMLSSGVFPGTVQLTPLGNLIILMRDCQVTGGYPRVLQLTENAVNKLAQKFTNDIIKFRI